MEGFLQGKTALISGGSMGLGRALAQALLSAGAQCFLVARDTDIMFATLKELQKEYGTERVSALCVDVSDTEYLPQIFTSMQERGFWPLDILINNAAVHGPIAPLSDVDMDDWAYAMRVNLLGPALLMRECIPHLPAHGKIINVAGGGATGPRPNFSAYAASKTALVRLTECVAAEYPTLDVNAMSPGAMTTRLTEEIYSAEQSGDKERYEAGARLVQSSTEAFIAPVALALWLASSASDGVSGRLISAVWDDYELIPGKKVLAMNNDDFTLRRQVPDWAKK